MPRPPILPVLDWKVVFESGVEFAEWIAAAENKDHAKAMTAIQGELSLEPHVLGMLQAVARPVYVVAIAEDWCGDVVRHAPALQEVADASPNVRVRFVSREQHPDVFVRFLTNGGEAIPKFVFLSDQFVECGSWGPMPSACREILSRGKACGDVGAAREKVAGMYNADSNQRAVIEELVHLVDIAATVAP